jgi:hypothetical protein
VIVHCCLHVFPACHPRSLLQHILHGVDSTSSLAVTHPCTAEFSRSRSLTH